MFFFYIANFRITVQIFRDPMPSQKATFKSEILELGSVSDPYSLNPDPDPAKNLNPDPERPWIRILAISLHYLKKN